MVSDLRNSISQIAEMITGGLSISSMKEQGTVYAHTTIQIDGDVTIAFTPDIIEEPDFETLTKQHMERVINSLKPLAELSLNIKRVKKGFSVIGIIGALTSVIVSYLSNGGSMNSQSSQLSGILSFLLGNFWEFVFFLLSLFWVGLGQLVGKIILIIAKYRAKHFIDKAKEEVQSRYM